MRNMTKRRRMLMVSSSNQSRLPDEYQEVEWLRGTGTQYCLTNYAPKRNSTQKTLIRGDVTVLNITDNDFALRANWVSNNNTYRYGITSTASAFAFYSGILEQDERQIFPIPTTTPVPLDLHYELNLNDFVLNGTSKSRPSRTLYNNSHYLAIGANIIGNTVNVLNKNVLVKAFSIYDETTLLCRVIPCYRKSDGKPGFYQTSVPEGGTNFITNLASGSDWLIGPNV